MAALIQRDSGVQRLLEAASNRAALVKCDLNTRITSMGRLSARLLYWSLQIEANTEEPYALRALKHIGSGPGRIITSYCNNAKLRQSIGAMEP